jgi:hypothetical protein
MALSDDQITQIRERLQFIADLFNTRMVTARAADDSARPAFEVGMPTRELTAAVTVMQDALAIVDQLRSERDAFKQEAGDIRRNYLKETKELAQLADNAEASLARLRTALEAIVKRGARQPDLKLIEIAQAALASTRPDASPGGEP